MFTYVCTIVHLCMFIKINARSLFFWIKNQFIDGCGYRSDTDGFSLNINVKPENKWASGYKGLIAYAFMYEKTKVKSFNWRIKHEREENFYFESKHNGAHYYWNTEEKTSEMFKVLTEESNTVNYFYSYFDIIKETAVTLLLTWSFCLMIFLQQSIVVSKTLLFPVRNFWIKKCF